MPKQSILVSQNNCSFVSGDNNRRVDRYLPCQRGWHSPRRPERKWCRIQISRRRGGCRCFSGLFLYNGCRWRSDRIEHKPLHEIQPNAAPFPKDSPKRYRNFIMIVLGGLLITGGLYLHFRESHAHKNSIWMRGSVHKMSHRSDCLIIQERVGQNRSKKGERSDKTAVKRLKQRVSMLDGYSAVLDRRSAPFID